MKIQVNTDSSIAGHAARVDGVSRIVEHALARFSEHITRVEVHLSDENSAKTGPLDQRCLLEARLQGRQPVAVTEHAASQDQAVRGAVDKLTHLLDNMLGRALDRRTGNAQLPFGGDEAVQS